MFFLVDIATPLKHGMLLVTKSQKSEKEKRKKKMNPNKSFSMSIFLDKNMFFYPPLQLLIKSRKVRSSFKLL